MTGRKRKLLLAAGAAALIACAAAGSYAFGSNHRAYYDSDSHYLPIKAGDSFAYAEGHPAFAEFSTFIQPWKDQKNRVVTPKLSIRSVCDFNHFNTQAIVDGFNFIIEESEKRDIFFDFYTEEERAADPSKEETGLIFIPGEKDKPFAFLVSGGAFQSVCLFAEAFPAGKELHDAGYNIFMLKYRVNPEGDTSDIFMNRQQVYANEDFGRAMQYIASHTDQFSVSMDDYSVWGFSAGGRLCHLWGLDNEFGYGHYGLPSPAATVLAYSGWYDEAYKGQYGTEPPTYLAWLDNDDVIGKHNVDGIKKYIAVLKELQIPVEDQIYHEAKHGFGAGQGTDAEGWMENAVDFWNRHIRKEAQPDEIGTDI